MGPQPARQRMQSAIKNHTGPQQCIMDFIDYLPPFRIRLPHEEHWRQGLERRSSGSHFCRSLAIMDGEAAVPPAGESLSARGGSATSRTASSDANGVASLPVFPRATCGPFGTACNGENRSWRVPLCRNLLLSVATERDPPKYNSLQQSFVSIDNGSEGLNSVGGQGEAGLPLAS